ncbi:MAG: PAS-domain containing protein [Hyphomicrobiales bacterium]|nr:PAS-domain containing protein [Rickettsiales bacterium]MCP5361879.1 PAS-domain containing protein [Hyphomicrobiales bacterium]
MFTSDPTILALTIALAATGLVILFLGIIVRTQRWRIHTLESIRKEVETESNVNIHLMENNHSLRIETERLLELINTLNFPVWVRDKDSHITMCNDAYRDLVMLDTPDNTNDTPPAIPELGDNSGELARTATSSRVMHSFKEHLITDGARKLYTLVEIPIPDGSGTVGYAYDVSELEEKEHELEDYIVAQSSFLESTSSAIAIYGPDTRLRYFNPSFSRRWHLPESWLKERPTYGEILERLREERKLPEQVNFREFKRNCLAMFTDLLEKHEEYYYLPDNQVLRVVAIPHSRGGLTFSYEDMTEHIALERSYNTLMSVKKSTIDNLFEGVAVFEESGKLQLSNPAYGHMWNLDLADLSGRPHLSDILDKTRNLYTVDDDGWKSYRERTLALLSRRELMKRKLERSDGSVLEWVCVPLPDGATLMTYTDITDSTRVEHSLRAEREALKEADRLKTRFLSTVSYELRSPLTSIRGFSEVLLKNYFGTINEKQTEYVRGIFDSSLRLTGLIDNILEIASLDAGKIRLELKEFKLCEAAISIIKLLEEKSRERRVEVLLECNEDVGVIYGDEKRIKQVILNLLDNAIGFSPPKRRVTVSIYTDGPDDIVIAIADQAGGIHPDEQEDIFNRFHKAETTSGIGLGLPVAKSLVEIHGGHMELESVHGEGTTVTCYLKRRAPKPEVDSPLRWYQI